jgi:hypothetical protein
MKKLFIISLLFFSTFKLSAQLEPLFWKNLSYYNPAFVDTDTVHYSDTWFNYQNFEEWYGTYKYKRSIVTTGALHNFTLPNNKTNVGIAINASSQRLLNYSSLKFRGSHKLMTSFGSFDIGLAYSINKTKYTPFDDYNIFVTPNEPFEIEPIVDYRSNLDLGLQYKIKGLTFASSVFDIAFSGGVKPRYIQLIQYDFKYKNFQVTPFFKYGGTFEKNEQTHKQIGGIITYKNTINFGYSRIFNNSNDIFIGSRIGKHLHVDYAFRIFDTYLFERLHQINVSYVWDKK